MTVSPHDGAGKVDAPLAVLRLYDKNGIFACVHICNAADKLPRVRIDRPPDRTGDSGWRLHPLGACNDRIVHGAYGTGRETKLFLFCVGTDQTRKLFMSRVRRSASTYPKFSPERDKTVLPINDEICIHSPLCYFIAKRRRASKIFLPEKKFFCQMPQKSLINSHECGRIRIRWKGSDKTAYWGVAKR